MTNSTAGRGTSATNGSARAGRRFRSFGLRARVGVIVFLVAAPLFAGSVLRLATDREVARAAAADDVGRHASLVSDNVRAFFDAARQALVAIAATPEARDLDPEACTTYLRDLLPAYPEYASLAVTDAAGNVRCSGVPTGGSVSVGDRPYFIQAKATGSFAVGDYSIGRVTGLPVIVVAQPIRDATTGSFSGAALASFPLTALARLGAEVDLPEGATLTIIDRTGTVLVREPDPQAWIGRTLPDNPLVAAMLAGADGELEAAGIDGVPRLYAHRAVTVGVASGIHVAVGYELGQLTAAADRPFWIGMGVLLLAAGVALALSWSGVRGLILRPTKELTAAADHIAAGDLEARTGFSGGGELGALAATFDRMAASVQERVESRTADLAAARAEAELARQEAEAARAEAERANESKTAFLSRMSHELRTPLNAVIGFGQLMAREPLTDGQHESVQHILKGGRHLLDLINEVLDISRIEAGTLTISPEPVHVASAVTEAAQLIAPLAEDRGIVLVVEDGDRHVTADRQRLKQVLLNLLSNAVKFNRPGGRITVSIADAAGDHVRVGVRDEGSGIPAPMRDRVFAPFDRLEAEASGVEGTGLGLALSKVLVERMGGAIGFDSAPGEGSTFWLELPAASPDAAQRRGVEAVEGRGARVAESGASGTRLQGTVLYVEDNLSNLQLVERLFALVTDVRVIPAMLGRLGIELAREHRPDLILLDMHLPDLDGTEVLGRLRADPRTREIPVVILSADATPAHRERLLARGAVAYVGKPIDVDEFLGLIDRVLGPDRPPAGGAPAAEGTG